MYTRQQFGKELKDKIRKKIPIEKIGEWSFLMFHYNLGEIDHDFEEILLRINLMQEGPEFEYSYEELEKIADDLILGKEVKI